MSNLHYVNMNIIKVNEKKYADVKWIYIVLFIVSFVIALIDVFQKLLIKDFRIVEAFHH